MCCRGHFPRGFGIHKVIRLKCEVQSLKEGVGSGEGRQHDEEHVLGGRQSVVQIPPRPLACCVLLSSLFIPEYL